MGEKWRTAMLMQLNVQTPVKGEGAAYYNLYKIVSYSPIPRIGEEVWVDDALLVVNRVMHVPLTNELDGRPQVRVYFRDIEDYELERLRAVDGWVDANQEIDDALG